MRRQGCGAPDRPFSSTFRYCILELDLDNLLSSFSYQIVTLVLTRVFHACLVQRDPPCRRARWVGREYFRQSSWRWLLHVVELLLLIIRMYLTIL